MPYRFTPLVNDNFYHIFNRGVEKRQIFLTERDYERFLQTLYYYQFSGPKPKFSNKYRFKNKEFDKNPKIVDLLAFCLMPNHFHLLIKQLEDGGTQEFLSKIANSYTKYFNTKHKRVGPLFQGQFKAVLIESDEQLIHVSRYIHLNPYVADITKDWDNFPYSSIRQFTGTSSLQICNTEHLLAFFKDSQSFLSFTKDYESYGRDIHLIKHLLHDME